MNFMLHSVIMFGFDFLKLQFRHEYDRVNLMSEFVIMRPHVTLCYHAWFLFFE
jgi:hypothetical protein